MAECRYSRGGGRKRKFAMDGKGRKKGKEVKRNEITKLR